MRVRGEEREGGREGGFVRYGLVRCGAVWCGVVRVRVVYVYVGVVPWVSAHPHLG